MLRLQVIIQLNLGLKFGLYVLEALLYIPVAEPFMLEPRCVAAKDIFSIFVFLVYIDIRLEVVKYIGPPRTAFAITSRTNKPVVRTQELGSFGCCW
jgi:hypothetical protein